MRGSNKLICWALFDSETGDYMSTVHNYFENKIDVYGVGLSHYGKNTDHYLNFDLSDFKELFGGENIGKRLLKALPKPDIIVASPPCESWSHMTSINTGIFIGKDMRVSYSLKIKYSSCKMLMYRQSLSRTQV